MSPASWLAARRASRAVSATDNLTRPSRVDRGQGGVPADLAAHAATASCWPTRRSRCCFLPRSGQRVTTARITGVRLQPSSILSLTVSRRPQRYPHGAVEPELIVKH